MNAEIARFLAPSLQAQIAELKRERKMRARVYPHLIASGKLQKQGADYQALCLDAAIQTLEGLVGQRGEQ